MAEKSQIEVLAFAVTGVSGSGKSSLCHRLVANGLGTFSISHTTRPPGPKEQNGIDYHFVTKEEFEHLIATEQMIEHATVHGHLYGTSIAMVESIQQSGKAMLLEIDVQGVTQARTKIANLHTIFILPPSYEALKERLDKRKREGQENINRRLQHGLNELLHIEEFEYLLLNEDFDKMLEEAQLIVKTHTQNLEPTSELSKLLTVNQQSLTEQWLTEAKNRIKSLHG